MTTAHPTPETKTPRKEKLTDFLLYAEGGEVVKHLEGITLRQARAAALELSAAHQTSVTLYESHGATQTKKVYAFGA